ncbi:cation transporting ATPase C-terminal domain-containing protein [Halapricum desulfuricans]|uniref:Cation transport ATPase n=1 Tax=Halapricum desulfuricans TaxID=2841257 RepID=A0A897NCG3_9EURY|nr:cation-translocating P-type ATPase C-terminal domain-containing protein [Halapricum desulfuricans]QSG10332.1 Cation transport ATPase [Halapricum desulfuricans]
MTRDSDIETPWSLSASDVLERLDVSPEGLSEEAVEGRRAQFGSNELREAERKHWTVVLADQFESFIVLLLAVAGVAAFLLGDVVESVAIFAVLGINGAIGFVTEMRAIGSIESLQELAEIHTRVRQAGEQRTVPADELVPGDVVVLQAGDFVPADLRMDPDEPIMTRTNWTELGFYGVVIAAATVGAFVIGGRISGGMATDEAVTISFLTLAFAQLWHVFDVREVTSGIVRNEVTENPYVWGALGLSTLILVGAVYLPGISLALGTAPIGVDAWSVVLGMSLLPLLVGQLEREARRRFGASNAEAGEGARSPKP